MTSARSFVATVLVAATATLATPAPAHAQFVKGNEAVKVLPDGTRKVELPPMGAARLSAPCPANQPGCTPSGWRMVETANGIEECTELHARPGTCRPSTYGVEKRPRVWVVKSKGQWLQCQLPDLGSKCVALTALPHSAVQ